MFFLISINFLESADLTPLWINTPDPPIKPDGRDAQAAEVFQKVFMVIYFH